MDYWVHLFAERTAKLSSHLQIAEDRAAIVQRLSDAPFVALLSWLTRHQCMDKQEYSDFCKGSTTHPNFPSYMRRVIEIWSRHDHQARSARRYGGALSVLYFSEELREKVGALPNRESLSTHLEKSLEAVVHSRPQN
ncbi:hypothetical protein D9M68_601520 [compost metagenome]